MTPAPRAPRRPEHSSWLRNHLGVIVTVTTVLSSLVTLATWLGWTPFTG